MFHLRPGPILYLYSIKGMTEDGCFRTQILGGDALQIPGHRMEVRDCPAGLHRAIGADDLLRSIAHKDHVGAKG